MAAAADAPALLDDDVPELCREVVFADDKLVMEHDAAAQAGADEEADERLRVLPRAEDVLAVGAGVAVVLGEAGAAGERLHRFDEGRAFPAGEVRRARRGAVGKDGDGHADADGGEALERDVLQLGRLAEGEVGALRHCFEARLALRLLLRGRDHRPVLVDDHRENLGAADVDAAEEAVFFRRRFFRHGQAPFAAATKERNSGCGSTGRLLNSGWNCTPMKKGCSLISTISTNPVSAFLPVASMPALCNSST